ncbi:hypothetical protein [Labrys sp. 22185]|uniref:hypothetical protein n=1 Tax=Labrys sp. 22185 TaxID=3453888 RepID=UPI003F872AB4
MRKTICAAMAASLLALSSSVAMAVTASQSSPEGGAAPRNEAPANDATPDSQAPGNVPARITQVQVVSINQLPPPIRKGVNEKIASTSPDDMRQLRQSIDQTPELSQSLKDYGATSAQVVAVNLDSDGVLTLIVSA